MSLSDSQEVALVSEVKRLKFLDRKHRSISEDAEAQARRVRDQARFLARKLRDRLEHLCDHCRGLNCQQECPIWMECNELLDALSHL